MGTHADRADQDDGLLGRQELQAEHLLQVATIELERRRPVEALQARALLEAGLVEMAFQRVLVAALDLVGQQQGEEAPTGHPGIELLGAGQGEPLGQRGRQGAQLEALEQAHHVGVAAHGVPSSAATAA